MTAIPPGPRRTRSIQSAFADIRADYDATRQSRFVRRRTGVSPMGSGADYHFRSETKYYELIEQARDMDRNDALVGILADRRVDNIVQSGFTLDPKTGDKGVDNALWQWWEDFSTDPDQCDIAGECTWKEIERQVCRSESIDGDIVVTGTEEGSFQMLESHLIRTKSTIEGTFLGVTTNKHGKREKYHVAEETGVFGQFGDSTPIDVRDADGIRQVFHVYNPKRVNVTRGVTQLAPVFSMAGMLEDINFAKLVQQQVVSCFAVFRKLAAGQSSIPSVDGVYGEGSTEQTASGVRQIEGVSPGMEIIGQPGEELTGFSPAVPNGEYFTQVKLILQIIGVNFGLPLCLVLMDGSETNFSGWRGAVDEARKGFVADQVNLVRRLNRPGYNWKLRQYLKTTKDAALKKAAKKLADAIFRHEWNLPSWTYIEPVADSEGDAAQIRNAQISPRRQKAARGLDHETIVDETIDDNSYAIEKAITQAEKINAAFPNSQPITWRDLIPLPMPTGQTIALQDPAAIKAQEEAAAAGPEGAPQPTGEFAGLSTMQWNRNRKAIKGVLDELAAGTTSESAARVYLGGIGLAQASIDALIKDATDGKVETPEVLADVAA
jgi:lambda family phage portal protein